MRSWYTINLGDAMLATEQLGQIRSLFLSEYEKADAPKEMAVFIRHESEGRLHCEVKAYFSPASIHVATVVGANPCKQPARDNLGLLAGSEESWHILFPDNDA